MRTPAGRSPSSRGKWRRFRPPSPGFFLPRPARKRVKGSCRRGAAWLWPNPREARIDPGKQKGSADFADGWKQAARLFSPHGFSGGLSFPRPPSFPGRTWERGKGRKHLDSPEKRGVPSASCENPRNLRTLSDFCRRSNVTPPHDGHLPITDISEVRSRWRDTGLRMIRSTPGGFSRGPLPPPAKPVIRIIG